MNKHAHHATCGCHDDKQDAQPTGGCLELLRQVVVRAAHFLPTQGPIGGFVHHNTLHSLQHKVFEDAVVEGAQLFDAEPFLSEVAYQSERRRQRILMTTSTPSSTVSPMRKFYRAGSRAASFGA